MEKKTSQRISTLEFVSRLGTLELKGKLFEVFDVDFNEDEFVKLIAASSKFKIEQSSDGLISHVHEDIKASALDNSRTTKFFGLHHDGQYLEKLPEIVMLYCVDPGQLKVPTVFANPEVVIEKLRGRNLYTLARELDVVLTRKDGSVYRMPLLDKHIRTGEEIIRATTETPATHLSPKLTSNLSQEEADEFCKVLAEISREYLILTPHYYKKGEMIVFDNNAITHGRGIQEEMIKNVADSKRYLLRIWLNRK